MVEMAAEAMAGTTAAEMADQEEVANTRQSERAATVVVMVELTAEEQRAAGQRASATEEDQEEFRVAAPSRSKLAASAQARPRLADPAS